MTTEERFYEGMDVLNSIIACDEAAEAAESVSSTFAEVVAERDAATAKLHDRTGHLWNALRNQGKYVETLRAKLRHAVGAVDDQREDAELGRALRELLDVAYHVKLRGQGSPVVPSVETCSQWTDWAWIGPNGTPVTPALLREARVKIDAAKAGGE